MATATEPKAAEATEATETEVQPAAPAPAPEVEAPKAEDTTEAPKAEDSDDENYVFNKKTVITYLTRKVRDKTIEESIVYNFCNSGWSAEQMKIALKKISKDEGASLFAAGLRSMDYKAVLQQLVDHYHRQVELAENTSYVSWGNLYAETKIAGNACLGVGVVTQKNGVIKRSGFGIYIRADHLMNSGNRVNVSDL